LILQNAPKESIIWPPTRANYLFHFMLYLIKNITTQIPNWTYRENRTLLKCCL